MWCSPDFRQYEDSVLNALKRKLTSQSGASITYALLLFLVCAVVSSVVLAAGTAASGRMSQSVESDQRYYSVTSAAGLLKEKLDHKSNSIVFIDSDNGKIFVSFDGSSSLPPAMSITGYASAVASGLITPTSEPVKLSLSVNSSVDEDNSLGVTVEMSVISGVDPVLQLDIYNTTTKPTDGKYTLRLKFKAGVEDIVKRKRDAEGKILNTVNRKITWNYDSITTLSAISAG